MFTFPLDPQALLRERTRQLTRLGIPAGIVARATAEIDDMWGAGTGGWVPVWARHAERAERQGKLLSASLCWGAARFPALATPERQLAQERQLDCYLRAARHFPVRFQRLVLDVPHGTGTTPVPVHLFRRRGGTASEPRAVLLVSGGVDTWKMDLHRLLVASALATGLLVAAVDMPGTGESALPLTPDSEFVLTGVVDLLRGHYGKPVGFFGLSFGGHWAAKLALLGRVDAAVDVGGPTGITDRGPGELMGMPHGMAGIIGNALGLGELPDDETFADLFGRFSLRRQGLLARTGGAPLLAANGSDDQYIPRADVTGLGGRAATTVWIVRGATHCAPEHFAPLVAAAWAWLAARLTPGRATRLAEEALLLALRPLLVAPASVLP
ncbi:alpha/beta hydrolase [Streptomyces cyaneus]|uniref:alpha/beta hydrolase n=1 Tax=Streptomyces cyaneus TaxID=1904 RepID=UPI000FF87F50|nr:alpha/beta hydrolase [Streptomyces cyaneus]